MRAGADAVFAGTPVRFAYLFGSRASGTAGPRSDVDVAVHLYGAEEPERVRYEAVMRRVSADFARHADALDRELLRSIAAGRVLAILRERPADLEQFRRAIAALA